MRKEEEVAGGVFYVLGLGFLSSLSSLLPLSLLAFVGAFVVGCGCAQGGGMLWVFALCVGGCFGLICGHSLLSFGLLSSISGCGLRSLGLPATIGRAWRWNGGLGLRPQGMDGCEEMAEKSWW